MKKFLSVMLLAVCLSFAINFFDESKADAKDVFAYAEGGIEYYIGNCGYRTLNPLIGAFGSVVKGVSGGKIVKTLYFIFNPAPSNGEWVYQIQDWTNGMARSYVVEEGYLSNSGKAQTVYNVTKNNLKIIMTPSE